MVFLPVKTEQILDHFRQTFVRSTTCYILPRNFSPTESNDINTCYQPQYKEADQKLYMLTTAILLTILKLMVIQTKRQSPRQSSANTSSPFHNDQRRHQLTHLQCFSRAPQTGPFRDGLTILGRQFSSFILLGYCMSYVF